MSIEELEKEGKIKRFKATEEEIEKALAIAERDLNVAKTLEDLDWAFNISYNSILQSLRAYMFSKGYRPSSEAGHVAVLNFTRSTLTELNDRRDLIDQMRKKRHRLVYDETGIVSESEIKNIIKTAEEILELIKNKTKK